MTLNHTHISTTISIDICYPACQFYIAVDVPENMSVGEILSTHFYPKYPAIQAEHICIGIYSKRCELDHIPKNFDRIEIYSPLIADPKTQRRKRVADKKHVAD